MSRFNAKYFFLFIIFIIVVALSSLFAQLYRGDLPIGIIPMVGYVVAVAIATALAFLLTNKLFDLSLDKSNEVISVEELFSYTHDPVTNLPTTQQASRAFDLAIKSGVGQRYAAVVFKPINFQLYFAASASRMSLSINATNFGECQSRMIFQ